jgi:hypothetical protein
MGSLKVILYITQELNNTGIKINCLHFTDDKIIIINLEDQLQKAINTLWKVRFDFKLKMSAHETKTMTFIGTHCKRSKTVVGDQMC